MARNHYFCNYTSGFRSRNVTFYPYLLTERKKHFLFCNSTPLRNTAHSPFIPHNTRMKKLLCTLALLSAFGTSFAQRFTLEGKASPDVKTIYYKNLQGSSIDSLKVDANGKFSLSGTADNKPFVLLAEKKEFDNAIAVVLNGDVRVDLPSSTVSGTSENHLLNEAQRKITPIVPQVLGYTRQLMALKQAGKTETPEFNKLYEQYVQDLGKISSIVKQSVKDHPEGLYNAALVYQYLGVMEESDIKELMTGKPACFETDLLKPIMTQLNKEAELEALRAPGKDFTDFKMATPTGAVKTLSSFVKQNKLTLVDFWASWCGPCRREMPHVKKLYADFHSKGLEIVGVSFDDSKEAWTGAIASMGLKWPQLSDLKGWQNEAGQLYGISSIPATLLIDKQGKIVAFGLRGAELEAKVAELLK